MWDEGQIERFADRLRRSYREGSDVYRAACDLLMMLDSVRFYEKRVRDLTEENERLRKELNERPRIIGGASPGDCESQ